MFNYKENKTIKSLIVLALVMLCGLSIGYIKGTSHLNETIIILSDTYANRLDAKNKDHVDELRRITESHRNSMSRISARLDNIVTRIERLENANQ